MASEMEKPFLPFEIIINILTRLPMKSIVRFQCVCKEWKNLFKTQSSISQHALHFAHESPFLLIHAYDHKFRRPTLRLLNQKMETAEVLNTSLIDSFRRGWRIIDSSNGLLCVELQTDNGRFPFSYLVWNPVINEVREVPHVLNDYGNASRVGFGYSRVANDYKIVRFYNPHLFDKRQANRFVSKSLSCVQVYSLNSGSWKELEMVKDVHHVEIYSEAANVNGTIFWKGHGYGGFFGIQIAFEMLIDFDIATEVFTVTRILFDIATDVGVDENAFCPSTPYQYGNKLAMCEAIDFVAEDDSKIYNMCMWVIEEGAGESGKSYTCTERFNFGPILCGLLPLCFWRNEIVCRYEVSEAEAEGHEKNYLHLFNLTTKEWKKFPNFSGAYDCCAIFNYEKSLCACLRHIG